MKRATMKLNVGCGKDIKNDYVNLDNIKDKNVDIIQNLNTYWSFKDNTFNEILMKDILEHLDKPILAIEEAVRICKNNGIIKIRVPHCKCHKAWGDITHVRPFSCESFKPYDPKFHNVYSKGSLETKRFELIRKKVKIIFPRLFHYIGLAKLFNMNHATQYIYERYFSGIIMPENIWFELYVKKQHKVNSKITQWVA